VASSCIFCEIIAGRQNARVIYRDDYAIAFHDLFPKAPVHILVVPVQHIQSVNQLSEDQEKLSGHLILTAQTLADEAGLTNSGYRLVINTGPDAGQSVHHLHLHLLGGKQMPMMGG
jgi:histidine triad (HIT) family protein